MERRRIGQRRPNEVDPQQWLRENAGNIDEVIETPEQEDLVGDALDVGDQEAATERAEQAAIEEANEDLLG